MLKKSKEHLEETGWNYWQHLKHSITQSNKLIITAVKSYVHGFFPCWFKSDGPITIIKMYHKIMRIQHILKIEKKMKSDGEI